jgi:hypothetical protein
MHGCQTGSNPSECSRRYELHMYGAGWLWISNAPASDLADIALGVDRVRAVEYPMSTLEYSDSTPTVPRQYSDSTPTVLRQYPDSTPTVPRQYPESAAASDLAGSPLVVDRVMSRRVSSSARTRTHARTRTQSMHVLARVLARLCLPR